MQIILFGAGNMGKQALNFYGIRNVFCFADNYKSGSTIYGKKIIKMEELLKIQSEYEIVISNEAYFNEISAQLKENGIKFRSYLDDLDVYQKKNRPCNPQILKVKGIHRGERIILIGNGPSLKVSDLENVKRSGFRSMACNFINKIFDKTAWRPDYYCCVEESAIALNHDFITSHFEIPKFIRGNLSRDYQINDCESVLWFIQSKRCEISEELEYVVYDYNTVMFIMIQFAIYMGFSEIFLLGVDNTQPPSVHTSNFIEAHTHFYEEEPEILEQRRSIMGHLSFENDYGAYQNHCNDGYICARKYAEKHGIKIYNATRGGKLEVFERVNIDSLFNSYM